MLRIFFTSSGVSAASVSRLLVIELARDVQHPRGPRAIRGNHVLLAPLRVLRRVGPRGQRRTECAGRLLHGHEPTVFHDLDTPHGRNVLEEATEVVLGVAGGYLF